MESAPLLRGSPPVGRRMAAAVAATACLVAVTCISFIVASHGGAVTLFAKAPKVYYVPKGRSQSARKQQDLQYFYVPISALPHSMQPQSVKKKPVFSQARKPHVDMAYVSPIQRLAMQQYHGHMLNETGADGGNASDAGGNGTRSCAIDSLKAQASAIFPLWDDCGYDIMGTGAITEPANNPECTPDNMNEEPCKSDFVRTVLHNDAEALRKCLLNVKGLSQTCDTFDGCGPTASLPLVRQGVCSAPDGGYYKEEEIQRMCGICSMFHAVAGSWAQTLDSAEDAITGEGGCFAHDATVKTAGGDRALISSLVPGDMIESHSGGFARVYFTHDHAEPMEIRTLKWSDGELQLTPDHMMPVFTDVCGAKFCAEARQVRARDVRAGDSIYTADGARTVMGVEHARKPARYVLVEGGILTVSGAVASELATSAGVIETAGFRFLDAVGLLHLKPVAAAITAALECPALRVAENMLRPWIHAAPKATRAVSLHRFMAQPIASV